jgi:hypothetical protein
MGDGHLPQPFEEEQAGSTANNSAARAIVYEETNHYSLWHGKNPRDGWIDRE